MKEHLQLVHYVVAEVAHRIPSHVNRNDLISAGMLGLAQAARSYDPTRGIPFDRFASTRIRGALLDELRGRDWATRSVRSRARELQSVTDTLTSELGRKPTVEELSKTMRIDTEQVHKLMNDVHRATVLNYESLVVDGTSDTFLLADASSPEQTILAREQRAYLTDAVAALPPRFRRVVVGYFFEDISMQELAAELEVSESRISQLRAEALGLLKEGMNAHLDPEMLPAPERPGGRVARRKEAFYDKVGKASSTHERISDENDVYKKISDHDDTYGD